MLSRKPAPLAGRRAPALYSIRCGSGLGDSLYLQSVARHFVHTLGKTVEVRSSWPEVFIPLGLTGRCKVTPFDRRANVVAHYVMGKSRKDTTQFQDCCIAAGLKPGAPLRLDWMPQTDWAARLRALAGRRRIIVVMLPRAPMNRLDGFGAELLPKCEAIQSLIDSDPDSFYVMIGKGKVKFNLKVDLDLTQQTTVTEVIDIVHASDGVLGYVSFIVPLAESLGKPLFCVWSWAGAKSNNNFVSTITPRKILEYPDRSFWTFDELPEQERKAVYDQFLEKASSAALV